MTDDQTAAEAPEVKLTEAARDKLTEVIEGHANPVAGLRLQILGRAQGAFNHVLSLVEDGAEVADDIVVERDGIRIFVERRNAQYLNGVEVGYEDKGAETSGLEFDNPNPLWASEEEMTIQKLFDEELNPAIAAHGGSVQLLEIVGDTAFIELGGGCVGCGMVDVTLKQGIEVSMKEAVPSIVEVVDQTDHGTGENPYYQPSKK